MEQGRDPSSSSSRTYDSSRRQADARARRRRVVDAARELFLESGFGDTSIERIAREAGVSVQTVYAVFGSKAGILHAVVDVAVGGDDEDVLVRDRPDTSWVVEERDPEQWLAAMALWIRRAHERAADVIHLMTSVAGADPAVGERRAELDEARRSDSRFAMEHSPLDLAAVGYTVAEAADVLSVLSSVWGWIEMVVEGSWTADRYETWLRDALCRELLPAAAPQP